MARYAMAGARVGTALHSRHIARDVEHLATIILRNLEGEDMLGLLPALGIPSDVSLLLGPVTIGKNRFAKHDTLLMMCAQMVSRHTGQLYQPMLAAPAMPVGAHGGDDMAKLALAALL